MRDLPGCEFAEDVEISEDARIYPSSRGTRIVIGAGTRIAAFAIIRCVGGSGDVVIGRNCYINEHCVLYSGNGITIGNDVLIAPGVSIAAANHAFADRELPIRLQGFAPSRGGVRLEDDVWIGANCVLLDGVTIGRGAVIAAGSVVTGSVPEYTVWAGTPARFVKSRP